MATTLLDANGMKRTLSRLAHEILDSNNGSEELVVVGVMRGGYPVAKRLAFLMTRIEGATIPVGKLDISSNRDDKPDLSQDDSEIPFQITGKNILLVDEVCFTGRTARAALEGILRYGRPKRVQFAVLIDRGHRELPIQPDFIGRVVETTREQEILVTVREEEGEDAVLLLEPGEVEAKA